MINEEFQTGVIRPLDCFKEGYEMIKPYYWLFFGITIVGMLIASVVPFAIILGAMYCGIYYCLFKLADRQKPEFGDLFKGFSYFVPSLIATAILIVPIVIFTIITWVSMAGMMMTMVDARGQINESAIFSLYGMLLVEGVIFAIVISCIHAFLIFTYPLIVERNMSGMDAFKLSARAAWANLGGVIRLILWQFLLGFVGYLACGVGLYFVFPVLFAGVFVAYRQVFPKAALPNFDPPPPDAYQGHS